MIRITLLEIIAVNRDYLMQSSSMALRILSMLHRNYDDITDEECIMSLALNDSIALMIFHADHGRAIANSREVIGRFPQSSHTYFIARHMGLIGRCLALSGKFEPAEETLQKALEMAERSPKVSEDSIALRADILHDLAMANEMAQKDHNLSIEYLEKVLLLLDSTSFEVRKGTCLMGLGNINYNQRKIDDALGYYLKASAMFEQDTHLHNHASVNSNIGLCYTDMGKMKMAENHLNSSLALRLNIGNPDMIAISYFNLARLFELQGNIDKAITNMLASRDFSRKSVNKYMYQVASEWLDEKMPTPSKTSNSAVYQQQGYVQVV